MALISFLSTLALPTPVEANWSNWFRSVQVKDRRGNTYIFKPDFVSCYTAYGLSTIICEGQAIKKNMSGRRYNVQLETKYCDTEGLRTWIHEPNSILCVGARKLGKYTPYR